VVLSPEGLLNERTLALIAAVCLPVLAGCDRTTSPSRAQAAAMETAFWTSAPIDQPSSALSLVVANEPTTLDSENPIDLILENASQSEVRFQPGFGARMYAYLSEEQRWVEVENRAEYVGKEEALTPPSGPSGNWVALVTVAPDLEGLELPVTLRVVVVGEILSEGMATGEVASAFADVLLER